MKAFCLAAVAALATAGAVGAATLGEGTGSAEFSGDWRNPTVVEAGFDRISGSWSGAGDHDILGFTSLRKGAQTITLGFSPKSPIGESDWGFATGGKLYYQFSAPRHAWDGTLFGSVDVQHWNRRNDFTWSLQLGDDFGGILYLSLFNTHANTGAGLNYSIDAPGNAPAGPQPAPVPLPAGAALLPAALAALAFLRRRRTR